MTYYARRPKHDIVRRGRITLCPQIQIKWLRLVVGAVEIIFSKQKCSVEMFVFVNLLHAFFVGNTATITAATSVVHRIFNQRLRNHRFDPVVGTVIVLGATAVGGLLHRLILEVNLLQYLKRFGSQQRFVGQKRRQGGHWKISSTRRRREFGRTVAGTAAADGFLRQFKLLIGSFRVHAFVFAFVAQQLTAGMQDIEAVLAHTMNVIALLRETAFFECAGFVFQELFEAVACQLFVFNVIGFVFFCGI